MFRRFILFSLSLCFFLSSQTLFAQLLSDVAVFGRANFSQSHVVGQGGFEKAITKHQTIIFTAGLNIFSARDIGINDVERGWATTAALGLRHYFNDRRSGLFVEADANIFFRNYKWRDNIGYANERTGNTRTVTLFPNLNVGYAFEGMNFWDFSPLIGLGYETHLKISGQEISKGIMPFAGMQVGYWFR